MATKTVAAGGGNFNTGATWVGGVAPVAGDDIVANATSGNLTLTATTVSLLAANFTGYTGTLAFGNFNMLFNTAGTVAITLATGMTITYGTGVFDVRRSCTFTSAGKNIQLDINGTVTVTLSGNMTITIFNSFGTGNWTFTGADVIYTGTSPTNTPIGTIASTYKWYFRPTGTMTFSSTANGFGSGYWVFDTTNTISIPSALLQNNGSSNTIEFAKVAVWSGGGTSGGRFNLTYDFVSADSGNTYTLIMTAANLINRLTVTAAAASATIAITNQIDVSICNFYHSTTAQTTSFTNAGGFTASSTIVRNTAAGATVAATWRFASDATWWFGDLSVQGNSTSLRSTISSITASTPTNVYINKLAPSYAQFTDITNLGTKVFALTDGGNAITRSSGFLLTAGTAETFVS